MSRRESVQSKENNKENRSLLKNLSNIIKMINLDGEENEGPLKHSSDSSVSTQTLVKESEHPKVTFISNTSKLSQMFLKSVSC